MNRLLRVFSACAVFAAFAACGDDEEPQKVENVTVTLFQAAPDAIEAGQSTKLLFAVNPSDAQVTITGVGDVTGKVQAAVTPTATTTYHLTATKAGKSATSDATVTVGPQTAAAIKVEPASGTPTAGESLSVTLTAIVGSGTTAPGFRGTVHLTSSDPQAVLPPDVVFAAADAGVKQIKVTLKTAGLETLTATDVASPARAGNASVTVQPAAATTYLLTALPSPATAGEGLALTITARDEFGNVATNYAGQAQFSSADNTDVLPAVGGFTAGVRTVSIAFRKAGSHAATVSEVGGTITADTNTITVGAAAPFRIAVAASNPATTAGTPEAFTATVVDFFDNIVTDYLGTVHFASNDPQAEVPADYTFVVGDGGSHAFTTTLKTAGQDTVLLSDNANGAVTGATTWVVGAAAAASCAATQAPASAVAGSVVGVAVTLSDPFGNRATGYAGTVRLTATDARAILPADVTYTAGDAGSHAFSAELRTTGAQTLTATDLADASIHCDASIAVSPGAPKLVLTLPSDANAGFSVAVGVTVQDLFDNAIPNYAGTVTFTNSDNGNGAQTPAPLVFTGSENGTGTANAVFVTIGAQTISASDGGAPVAAGTARANIHGLVYTGPNTGRVRLVANAAQSNTRVVQLDLVANERLEVSSFFGGGPGPSAAGMNLPLDTTRVGADQTLFTPGSALPPGTGTRAAAGRIGSDSVLYTVVSRKRVAGTVFNQETEVPAGGVFYSVRLRLLQNGTVGPVFDGAQPSPLFRAGVRDQFGDDFVNLGEFGIGKLEIR